MADHSHGNDLIRRKYRLRTFRQDRLRVNGLQSDQLFSIVSQTIGAMHTAFANEAEGFVVCNRPAVIKINRCD